MSAIPSQVATASSEDIRMQEMHSRERLGAIVVFNSLEELKLSVRYGYLFFKAWNVSRLPFFIVCRYFPAFIFRFEQKQKAMLMERRIGGRRQGSFPPSLSCRNSVVTFQDPPFQTVSPKVLSFCLLLEHNTFKIMVLNSL